jgi:hypothetical protein
MSHPAKAARGLVLYIKSNLIQLIVKLSSVSLSLSMSRTPAKISGVCLVCYKDSITWIPTFPVASIINTFAMDFIILRVSNIIFIFKSNISHFGNDWQDCFRSSLNKRSQNWKLV